jgi:predicted transcriptional regulator
MEQITLTISPELRERIDKIADKLSQSRAAMINLAIYEFAERHNPEGQG